jgi:hypothetical protein
MHGRTGACVQSLSQYSLFRSGMFTYTYERQDIIQIVLKRLQRRECREKMFKGSVPDITRFTYAK